MSSKGCLKKIVIEIHSKAHLAKSHIFNGDPIVKKQFLCGLDCFENALSSFCILPSLIALQ